MNEIVQLNEAEFEPQVLGSSLPVLVDFYAPWCGPCKMIGPLLEQISLEFRGRIKFVKVDVDEAGSLAYRYGVTGVPTLMLFRDGQPVDRVVGFVSPKALTDWLEHVASPVSA